MDEESTDVFINVAYAKVPPDQLELDTTIDWFKYLDDESTGVYDFGDKCLKKHRAVGSIRYSRISFKSCAWKRNFYYDSHVVSILMTYEELNFILPSVSTQNVKYVYSK